MYINQNLEAQIEKKEDKISFWQNLQLFFIRNFQKLINFDNNLVSAKN